MVVMWKIAPNQRAVDKGSSPVELLFALGHGRRTTGALRRELLSI
jgi:hypothetical protein